MLKGIDAQLMVTRTADLAREADIIQRKNDLVRDYLAVQTQALAEQKKLQVAHTLGAQRVEIHPDKQGGGQQGYQTQQQENDELSDTTEDEYLLPPTANQSIIDIKI